MEEKAIQKKFPNEYHCIIAKSNQCDMKFHTAFSALKSLFQFWPIHQKATLLLKNSQWKQIDALWPQIDTFNLDPILVGRYFLHRARAWDTFILWQPLLSTWVVGESDKKTLINSLHLLFSKPPLPLLKNLGHRGLEWLFIHISKKNFKTIIHCHLAFFIYHGQWKKGLKFYWDITNKHTRIFLGQTKQANCFKPA